MSTEELFKRTNYLSELLKREEVLQKRLTPNDRQYFDQTIQFMQSQRLLTIKDDKALLKSSGEALLLMIGSICWPMIDTYYITLLYSLTLVKQKNSLEANFAKDVQWLAETLFSEQKTMYYESCNQPAIGNAKSALLQMKVLAKNGPQYITLGSDYQKAEGEKKLLQIIEYLNQFRMKPMIETVLDMADENYDLRKILYHDFPVMSKL